TLLRRVLPADRLSFSPPARATATRPRGTCIRSIARGRTMIAIAAFLLAALQDKPAVPEKPIAEKKEILFQDDFEGSDRPKESHKVVPTFAFENGTLKGTQTRDKTIPAADGKPAQTPHAAVHGLEIPTKDSIVEVKIKFEGATMIDVEFDDRKY